MRRVWPWTRVLLAACIAGVCVAQDAPPTTSARATTIDVDGSENREGVRVLVASRPPTDNLQDLGWTLDKDTTTDAAGRVVLDLDARRVHFVWAVDHRRADALRASDLALVTVGSTVRVTLQDRLVAGIKAQIPADWSTAAGLMAFDVRMPGVGFPCPLPRDSASTPPPPLPFCYTPLRKGKTAARPYAGNWRFLLTDDEGEWLPVASMPLVNPLTDSHVQLKFGAPTDFRGRIVDKDGRGIAGARVDLMPMMADYANAVQARSNWAFAEPWWWMQPADGSREWQSREMSSAS